MKYTDLELNKMIAELEGWDMVIYNHAPFDFSFSELSEKRKVTLFDLMVKYKVEIDYLDCECSIWRDDLIEAKATTRFKSESEIPRAIIECILKSENII